MKFKNWHNNLSEKSDEIYFFFEV